MNMVWPVKSSAPANTTSVSAMPNVAPMISFCSSGGAGLPSVKMRMMPRPMYAPASIDATKNAAGDSRIALTLRSASFVNASMVSSYTACLRCRIAGLRSQIACHGTFTGESPCWCAARAPRRGANPRPCTTRIRGMREPQPKTIHLEDYTPPAFRVETVELDVDIREDHALVRAKLELRRNAPGPLVLDGDELELVSISVPKYRVTPEKLTIEDAPDAFMLETLTRIVPQKNTKLEGLYAT